MPLRVAMVPIMSDPIEVPKKSISWLLPGGAAQRVSMDSLSTSSDLFTLRLLSIKENC